MRTIRKGQDPVVAEAAAGVDDARSTLAQWESERAAAEAELTSLQQRAGDEILNDPTAAAELPRQMQALRDRIDITNRAVDAQAPRVTTAERAYLQAEAEVVRRPVAELEKELQRHEARTAELLKELEQHEGPFVPKGLLDDVGPVAAGERRVIEMTRSEILHSQTHAAALPVLVLTEMAEGRDPQQHPALREVTPAEVYPACVWGPDALVKAPAYLRTIARQVEERRVVEAGLVEVRRRVAELEGDLERGQQSGGDRADIQDWTLARKPKIEDQLARATAQRENLEQRLAGLPA